MIWKKIFEEALRLNFIISYIFSKLDKIKPNNIQKIIYFDNYEE